MLRRSPPRLASLAFAALLLAAAGAVAGCEAEPEPGTRPVRSVADFDKYPCGLFTKDEISGILVEPFEIISGTKPVLNVPPREGSTDDGSACVYTFAPATREHVPQVAALTVSLGRSRAGEQQLANCLQGAAARARGYQGQPIGEKACVAPSGDLWMKVGTSHYHVVAVVQPGWTDVVEGWQAARTVTMTVGNSAADRLPRS